MNRHERRRARATGNVVDEMGDLPSERSDYVATANATLAVFRAFLAVHPDDPPRFALVERDIALAISLLDFGHKLARNGAAHELVDVWVDMTRALKLRDGPTYMMLLACIEILELPFEATTLDELGLKVRPAGNA